MTFWRGRYWVRVGWGVLNIIIYRIYWGGRKKTEKQKYGGEKRENKSKNKNKNKTQVLAYPGDLVPAATFWQVYYCYIYEHYYKIWITGFICTGGGRGRWGRAVQNDQLDRIINPLPRPVSAFLKCQVSRVRIDYHYSLLCPAWFPLQSIFRPD